MWSLYIFVFYRPALSIFDILLSLSYYWCVWLKIRCHVFHYRLNRVFEDKLSKVVGNEFQNHLVLVENVFTLNSRSFRCHHGKWLAAVSSLNFLCNIQFCL